MKFMIMVKAKETEGPPPAALMTAIAALGVEATEAGVLLSTGRLGPTAMGTRVRMSGGKRSVTDGPFAESKEVVGGFAIYDLPSKAEAVEWTERFMELHSTHWPGWNGEAEIRPLFGPGDDFSA